MDRSRSFQEVEDPEVGGKVVSPSTGRIYPQGKIPGTHIS